MTGADIGDRKAAAGSHTGSPRAAPNNLLGIAGVLGAGLFMICSDACLRAAMTELPLGQVIAGRGIVACTILAVAAMFQGSLRWHPALLSVPLLIRVACEIGAALLFVSAIAAMPFANATAILQFIPLVTTVAAARLFSEVVGWQRWAAGAIGLAGVLMIIQPGASGFTWWSLVAVAAMLCMSTRDLATSRMDPRLPTLLVGTVSAAAVTLSGVVQWPLAAWPMPSPIGIALLVAAGVLLAAGFYCLVVGMRSGEVSAVAPFRYGTMIWALAIGILVWDETPNALALSGFVIVVGAGLATFARERRLRAARVLGQGGR